MKKIALRNASAQDWETIVALHKAQQAAQGTSYELPQMFTSRGLAGNIPVCLVSVTEEGEILNCVYVERIAELRFVGCDSKATAFSRREIDGLAYILRLLGYRFIECYVPQKLFKYIKKPLEKAGFVDKQQELAYFSRDLRKTNV